MLTVVGIYYWGVHRPDITGYGTAFLVGLLEDLMGATPLGVSSLTLIVSLMIVLTQERFFRDQSFAVAWSAFVLLPGLQRWCVGCCVAWRKGISQVRFSRFWHGA